MTEAAAKKHVSIFTDGACKGNPGPGGWGVLLRMGAHEKEMAGGQEDTTNNRMELMAAIKGLEALNQSCAVDLYSDSKYVIDGITKWIHGWQKRGWINAAKKPVANADLWRELWDATSRHEVNWHWVKGHSGHAENDRVDQLASDEAARIALGSCDTD